MKLLQHIRNSRVLQREKGWPKLYWAIDLHGTLMPPSRNHKDVLEFLGPYHPEIGLSYAELALVELSQRSDQCILLWTATDSERIWKDVVPWMQWRDIRIGYHNENPEVKSEGYARFSGKFYFDILLDDKAGFDTMWWKDIYEEVKGWS